MVVGFAYLRSANLTEDACGLRSVGPLHCTSSQCPCRPRAGQTLPPCHSHNSSNIMSQRPPPPPRGCVHIWSGCGPPGLSKCSTIPMIHGGGGGAACDADHPPFPLQNRGYRTNYGTFCYKRCATRPGTALRLPLGASIAGLFRTKKSRPAAPQYGWSTVVG